MNKFVQFAVVVLAVSAVVAAGKGEHHEKFKKDMQECKAETQASDDDAKNFMRMKEEESSEAECFVGCMYEKYGILVDGVFSKDNSEKWIAKKFPGNEEIQVKAQRFIDECEAELADVPADKCSSGPALRKCIARIFKQLKAEKQQQ